MKARASRFESRSVGASIAALMTLAFTASASATPSEAETGLDDEEAIVVMLAVVDRMPQLCAHSDPAKASEYLARGLKLIDEMAHHVSLPRLRASTAYATARTDTESRFDQADSQRKGEICRAFMDDEAMG